MIRPSGEAFDVPLVVDTSALLCRYLSDPRRAAVEQMVGAARYPVVTSLARTEVAMGLHLAARRTADVRGMPSAVWAKLAADWSRFWIVDVAVDGVDGVRAAEVGAEYGLNLANALHLVAMDRLPRPVRLLTFDDRQVAAAADLGIEIVEAGSAATAHGLLA